MSNLRVAFIVVGVSGMLCASQPAAAQLVNYNGDVTLFGSPVSNGFVIAGTFAPSFDPQNYKYVYGDAFGNLLTTEYSQAVADGNFRPIGSGTTTFPDGAFAGTGVNLTGVGQLVYLFAFDQPNPDLAANFALATSPSWVTGAATLSISGADASSFVFGENAGSTIGLNVLPFPEPSSFALAGLAVVAAALRVRRRRRT